jgi:hypothetical protein
MAGQMPAWTSISVQGLWRLTAVIRLFVMKRGAVPLTAL